MTDQTDRLMIQQDRRVAWGSGILFEVGAYRILRGLVRAPGAWLVEAEDPAKRRTLLQLAQLRPINSVTDRIERGQLEQTVLGQSTTLLDEEDQVILAHGGVDRIDGTRVLFWALPLPEQVDRLASPASQIETVDRLLSVGIEIGRRCARRNALGRTEPLLNEQLFLVTDRRAELVGVPVHLPPSWLATDMPRPRLAPEERDSDEAPTTLGDVWRLGRALSTLSGAFEPLPERVRSLLGRMTAPAPDRVQRVEDAVAALSTVRAELQAASPPSPIHGTTSVTAAMPLEVVSELVVQSMGDSTRVEAADPAVPPWAFFFSADEYRRFREITAGTGAREGRLAEMARLCRGEPPERWESLMQAFRSEAPTLHDSIDDSFGEPTEETGNHGAEAPVDRLLEGLILGQADAAPTIAESPFAVGDVEPPMVVGRTIADVKPLVLEPDTIDIPKRGLIEDSVSSELPVPEFEAAPAKRRPTRRHRLILSLLGALAALGGLALAGRTPARLAGAPVLHLERPVTLEVETPNAVVVGEDGTIISAPLVFAVPDVGQATVLVAAEGHRPERVLLPTGGTVRISLAARGEEEPCEVKIPAQVEVEMIGAELDRQADHVTIDGSAVIRLHKGEATAAHLVRCGADVTLPRPTQERTFLGLDGDAHVILDGGSIGHAPLEREVRAGFHRADVEGTSRWIPVFGPVLLE